MENDGVCADLPNYPVVEGNDHAIHSAGDAITDIIAVLSVLDRVHLNIFI